MFVDTAKVTVKAGNGGNGLVSFRREKFVERGGPDGGDGGNGGDVVFIASNNQNTLANFRYHKELKGEDGQNGSKRKRHGKSGGDLNIKVPVGTVVYKGDKVIADLTEDKQGEIIANGGKGGFGNAHFVSSTRQAPKVAEKGEEGESVELQLELKIIADVGLVGLPNAGKSTLLSVISNAHPDVANYPFTTLTPNLGVVDVSKDKSLLVADIPGLIKGASKGKGLGDEFLRHIERTKVLIHLIDAYHDDLGGAYKTIQKELKDYRVDLSKLPQIVVLSKIDGLDAEIIGDRLKDLKKALSKKVEPMAISAKSGQGLKELLFLAHKLVGSANKKATKSKNKKPVIKLESDDGWSVQKTKKGFLVTGKKIERFAARTDSDNDHSVQRLRDIMQKLGILNELQRRGIKPNQAIIIGESAKISY